MHTVVMTSAKLTKLDASACSRISHLIKKSIKYQNKRVTHITNQPPPLPCGDVVCARMGVKLDGAGVVVELAKGFGDPSTRSERNTW